MRKVTFLDWISEHGKTMMMMSKRNSNQSRAKTYLRFEKQNSLLLASLLRPQKCLLVVASPRALSRGFERLFWSLCLARLLYHTTQIWKNEGSLWRLLCEIFCLLVPHMLGLFCRKDGEISKRFVDFAALHSLWRKFFGTIPSTYYVIVLTTFLYTTST